MKVPGMSFAVVLAILFCSQATATKECNLYNFVMSGAYECANTWWDEDGVSIHIGYEVTYNISDVIESALLQHGVSLSEELEFTLFGLLQNPFTARIDKLVESILTAEPFLAVLIADFMIGLDLDDVDTTMIGISQELASKETLTKVVEEYMNFGCTLAGANQFTLCMKSWIDNNCNSYEDEGPHITFLILDLKDVYCDAKDSRKVDPEVVKVFTEDLGSMTQAIGNFFGIARDPNSKYLFNVSEDSILSLTNPEGREQLANKLEQSCGFYISALTPDFEDLFHPNNTLGTGVIVKNTKGIYESFVKCGIEQLTALSPDMFTKEALKKYEIVLEKYGLSDLFTEDVEDKKERHTVSVFGDPHMITYRDPVPVTCSALGWQTYLFNKYFHLQAFAERANGVQEPYTYVTKVNIDFLSGDAPVQYLSEEGDKPSKYLVVGDDAPPPKTTDPVVIKEVGEGVQIIQNITGAVFAFRKHRDSYYFTVRMGKDVFEQSYGLLIGECADIIDINEKIEGGGRDACDACNDIAELYRKTCLFDCIVTADDLVPQISVGIQALQKEVDEQDKSILKKGGDDKDPDDGDRDSGSRLSDVSGLLTFILLSYILTNVY